MSGLFGGGESSNGIYKASSLRPYSFDTERVNAFVNHMNSIGTPVDPEVAKTLVGLNRAVDTQHGDRFLGYTDQSGKAYGGDQSGLDRLVKDFQSYQKNKSYLDYVDTAKSRPGRSATILTPYSGPDAKTLLGASNSKTVLGG